MLLLSPFKSPAHTTNGKAAPPALDVLATAPATFPANGIIVIHKQHSIGKLGNHAAHESQPKGDAQSPVDGMAPQKAR